MLAQLISMSHFSMTFYCKFNVKVELYCSQYKRKIRVILLSLVFPSLLFGILLGMSELIQLICTCYEKTSYLHVQSHSSLI